MAPIRLNKKMQNPKGFLASLIVHLTACVTYTAFWSKSRTHFQCPTPRHFRCMMPKVTQKNLAYLLGNLSKYSICRPNANTVIYKYIIPPSQWVLPLLCDIRQLLPHKDVVKWFAPSFQVWLRVAFHRTVLGVWELFCSELSGTQLYCFSWWPYQCFPVNR